MKKSRGILVLVLTVLITGFLVFTSAVGLGPTGTGAAKHIKTGLDLAGGVSITYEASKKNPTDDEMADTIYKLQKRVEQYSSEAQVYKEGTNRINVEIPGVTMPTRSWKSWENRAPCILLHTRVLTVLRTTPLTAQSMF